VVPVKDENEVVLCPQNQNSGTFQTSTPSFLGVYPLPPGCRVGKFVYIPFKRGDLGGRENVM